jgi:hypothetical protein
VQSLAGRDARLRGVRDARSSRFCSAALIILEESVPSYSIGMEPHFESPSEAEVHKLSVLCLYEPVSNCSLHIAGMKVSNLMLTPGSAQAFSACTTRAHLNISTKTPAVSLDSLQPIGRPFS